MTMIPDEVVKNLQDLLKDDWDLMRWKEAELAFRTAISLIQDYQKLRERIDEGKITEVVRKTKYVGMVKHYELVPDWCKSIAQAIVTYLQQPTEH